MSGSITCAACGKAITVVELEPDHLSINRPCGHEAGILVDFTADTEDHS